MNDQRIGRVFIGSLCMMLVGIPLLIAPVSGGQVVPARVVVETDPDPANIIPDETLVQTRVRVVDVNGQLIPGARIALHLDTPPPPRVFTTDFPWVEGTTLLDLAVEAPDGELRFTTMYPIRGRYTFQTQVTLPDGTTLESSPTLSISENPAEIHNFLLFLILLFGTGFASGVIIGRRSRTALTLFLLGTLLLVGSDIMAHNTGQTNTDTQRKPITARQTNGQLQATLTVTPGTGLVGVLNTVQIEVTDIEGSPITGEATLLAWHIEDERPVYTFHLPLHHQPVSVQMQFFDGADHELRLEAVTEDRSTVTLSTPIAVEPLSPPFWLKIRMLLMLLGVVTLGLITGFRVEVSGRLRRK